MSNEIEKSEDTMGRWTAWGTLGATAVGLMLPPVQAIAKAVVFTVLNPMNWIPAAITIGAIGGAVYAGAWAADKFGLTEGALDKVNKTVFGALDGLKKVGSFYAKAFGRAFEDVTGFGKKATEMAEAHEKERAAAPEADAGTSLRVRNLNDFQRAAKDVAAKTVIGANDLGKKAAEKLRTPGDR